MKDYKKPISEIIDIKIDDALLASGIEVNNTNAGFNNSDETL